MLSVATKAANKLGAVARRLLPRSRFARSVSVLAGGTAAGQLIVVAASPVLTRLYSPEDFGLLAVYAGLLGILGVVASLRYQLAIPLPESDEEAASITVLSLLVVLGMTVLSAVLVTLFGSPLIEALNAPALEPYLWLLPFGLLFTGVYQVLQYWGIRTKAFPAIARTKLTKAIGMVAVQVGGYPLGPVALLTGQVGGHAAGSTSLGALVLRKRASTFRKVRLGTVVWAANRYRRFPLFSSWAGAFNTTGTQLPPVLFAAMFHPGAAGIYLLAHRVLAMPVAVLGMAIADVFTSSAVEARREGELATLVASIHHKLAHIAMPPALILMLAGPELFAIVFGGNWHQAGEFAQWMAPWIYMQFVTSPLTRLSVVLEKQIHDTVFQGILLMTRTGSLLVGGYLGDLMVTVALFSVSSALCYFGVLVWLFMASGNLLRESWSSSLKALAISSALVIPLACTYVIGQGQLLWLVGLILTGLLVGGRYAFIMRKAW